MICSTLNLLDFFSVDGKYNWDFISKFLGRIKMVLVFALHFLLTKVAWQCL